MPSRTSRTALRAALRLALLATLALLGVALPAAAPAHAGGPYVLEGSWEAGVQLGGYFHADDEADRNHTVGYRIFGAYHITDILGVELDFEFAPAEVNVDSIYTVHADLLIHPVQHDWAVPFIGIGPSFSVLVLDVGEDDSDPGLNAIAGIKLYPWEYVGFRIDARYLARFGTDTDEPTSHDVSVMGGLFVSFGGDRDTGPVDLDTDGDGFLDTVDKCPTVPGVATAEGCPDQDGDTVVDADDRCPADAGDPAKAGCPDQDGDGLVDIDDRCPTKPGPEKDKGCPDTDGDALVDVDDRCPLIPGEEAYQGCPPPPPEEIVKQFSGRIAGVTFKVDSDEILPESFAVLDQAATVLGEYRQLIVLIEGHTSSEGAYDYNVKLSQRRADSVKRYLVSKGIDDARLETKGFGPDRPIADNATEDGREQNRRIEFKILRQ